MGKTKRRLCWNCEGEILLDAVACPYCGMNVEGEGGGMLKKEDPLDPPYRLAAAKEVPQAPYPAASSAEEQKTKFQDSLNDDPRTVLLSLLLTILGGTLAVFGLAL